MINPASARRIDAVLFDLDGVLTPTADVHKRAWAALFTGYLSAEHPEAQPYESSDYYDYIDGRPRYDGVAAFLASRNIALPHGDPSDAPGTNTVCGLGNRKNDEFRRVLRDEGVRPYPGTQELLERLGAANVRVAVVSSSRNAKEVLAAAGLTHYFGVVIDGEYAARHHLAGKPEPATYLAAAELLGVPAEAAVVVEDAISGVQAGANGGFGLVVGVDQGVGRQQLLDAGANVVVADLAAELEAAVEAALEAAVEAVADAAADAALNASLNASPGAEDALDSGANQASDPNTAAAWRLTERTVPDGERLGWSETVNALGNGYLGVRGNQEEGGAAHEHGTFINGFHETWPITYPEAAHGFAEVGQTILNLPDAKTVELTVDGEPFDVHGCDILEYQRTLDLAAGTLERTVVWRTKRGTRIRVRSTRMVSFRRKNLVLVTYEVTPLDAPATVQLRSSITDRQHGHVTVRAGFDPRRSEAMPGALRPVGHGVQPFVEAAAAGLPPGDSVTTGRQYLTFATRDSGMAVAVMADHQLLGGAASPSSTVTGSEAVVSYELTIEVGRSAELRKRVAYHDGATADVAALVTECAATLGDAPAAPELRREQREWLAAFWADSDVQLPGQPEAQLAVRWNLYQVAQASARADGRGVAAKGVTGSGYSGHYFWDTEIFVLPYLIHTQPAWARKALEFRHSLLPAARRRARVMDEKGALFAWRTINGEEASAYYPAGTAQYHIDADVSYAVTKYITATADRDFEAGPGAEILVETARMWASLGFYGDDGAFHINGVTGPDEYSAVVDDNYYTNVMAAYNLERAAAVVAELEVNNAEAYSRLLTDLSLEPGEPEGWLMAAARMALPEDPGLGVHLQDARFLQREPWDLTGPDAPERPLLLHYHPLVIYRRRVLKQADLVLALYLLSSRFSPEQKRADFDFYDPLTTGDSTLSAAVQAIVAAEVGREDVAMEHFQHMLRIDLDDLHQNTADGVHVAAAGGTWQALVAGFGGMRDDGDELRFDPRLPERWEGLGFVVRRHGAKVRVELRSGEVTFALEEGYRAELSVRGARVTLDGPEPVTVPLSR